MDRAFCDSNPVRGKKFFPLEKHPDPLQSSHIPLFSGYWGPSLVGEVARSNVKQPPALKVKAKQSRYIFRVAQRVPGS
jgi:hypothetical protein